MKKLLIFSCLFFCLNGISQGFEFKSLSDNNQYPTTAREMTNGHYLLITSVDTFSTRAIKLIELDNQGLLQSEHLFMIEDKQVYIRQLHKVDDGFIAFGVISESSGGDDAANSFIYLRISNDLSVQSFNIFNPDIGDVFSSYGSKVIDNTIIFCGSTNITSDFNIFGGKIYLTNNTFSFTQNIEKKLKVQDLCERTDSMGYIIQAGHYFYFTDSLFNIKFSRLSSDPFIIHTHGNATRLSDSTIITTGNYKMPGGNSAIATLLVDEYYNEVFLDTIASFTGSDLKNVPFFFNSIDLSPDKQTCYTGGIKMNVPNLWFSEEPNTFILNKYNTEPFEKTWSKTYGGDANYIITGNLYTSDGGCLMYGTRYAPENEYLEAYALKVDENGIITGETFVPMPSPKVKIYPNPFVEDFSIEMDNFQGTHIVIFDVLGKEVHREILQSNRTNIKLNNLIKGTYTYVLSRGNLRIKTGQLIKK